MLLLVTAKPHLQHLSWLQFTGVALSVTFADYNSDQHGRPGDWRDNVIGERLWRSIKYEEIPLAYDTESDARARPISQLIQWPAFPPEA